MNRPASQALQHVPPRNRAGFSLLESLLAALIVSFGVIGIMGLQSSAITSVQNANLRSEAGLLANEMIGLLWADRTRLASYTLNADGAGASHHAGQANPCANGSNASSNAVVGSWIAKVEAALPGAAGLAQSVTVDPSGLVSVTICWKGAQDPAPHNHSALAQIQG